MKLWRTVLLPVVSSLNIVPQPKFPQFEPRPLPPYPVVPYRFPALSRTIPPSGPPAYEPSTRQRGSDGRYTVKAGGDRESAHITETRETSVLIDPEDVDRSRS